MKNLLESFGIPITASQLWMLLIIILVYMFVVLIFFHKANRKLMQFISFVGTVLIIIIWCLVVLIK